MTEITEDRSYAQLVGARLRAVRVEKRFSLRDVEERSDGLWRIAAVGSYERGDREITVSKLAGLAEFYGVPVYRLLPDTQLDTTAA